jgi:hypothetical protein
MGLLAHASGVGGAARRGAARRGARLDMETPRGRLSATHMSISLM